MKTRPKSVVIAASTHILLALAVGLLAYWRGFSDGAEQGIIASRAAISTETLVYAFQVLEHLDGKGNTSNEDMAEFFALRVLKLMNTIDDSARHLHEFNIDHDYFRRVRMYLHQRKSPGKTVR